LVELSKKCNHCREDKPLSVFHRRVTSLDGHGKTCKDCVYEFNRSYREKHREKIAAKHRAYWQREHVKASSKVYQNRRNLEKLERVAGRPKPDTCEICGKGGKICYDHSHKTGKFRGWLCSRCNLYLGGVQDNIEILNKMVTYLVKNGT